MKNFYLLVLMSMLCIVANSNAAQIMSNGIFFSKPTQQFIAQDGDTEQGGYQFFQGQIDYSNGVYQQQLQQQYQEMQIQNKMEAEYQQQIDAQSK